jgi:hypothetical protein
MVAATFSSPQVSGEKRRNRESQLLQKSINIFFFLTPKDLAGFLAPLKHACGSFYRGRLLIFKQAWREGHSRAGLFHFPKEERSMTTSSARLNAARARATSSPGSTNIFRLSPFIFIDEKKCRCRLRCAEEFRHLDYNAI